MNTDGGLSKLKPKIVQTLNDSGNRFVVKNGTLNKKYNVTVPGEVLIFFLDYLRRNDLTIRPYLK